MALYGLAAHRHLSLYERCHRIAREFGLGFVNHHGRHFWRIGDRILGNPNKPLALLHRRTSTFVDNPRLAHRNTND